MGGLLLAASLVHWQSRRPSPIDRSAALNNLIIGPGTVSLLAGVKTAPYWPALVSVLIGEHWKAFLLASTAELPYWPVHPSLIGQCC